MMGPKEDDEKKHSSTPVELGPRFKGVVIGTTYEQRGELIYPVSGGVVSMADDTNNVVENVSPTGKPMLPQWLVIVALVLTAVAGVLVALPGLPVGVTAAAGVVLAIGSALGIASPGVRQSPPSKS